MKVKVLDEKCIPYKKYKSDRGWDLKARIDETISIHPNGRITVPTGLCVEVPECYVGDVRPRSGLAKGKGVVAAYGTIDAYTGEVGVTLFNLSTDHVKIEPYERVAQLVLVKISQEEIEIVEELEPTERGSNGFGSTGNF